ncbi:MAG: hypothetical protein ACYDHC_11700 [Desulfuromonadaceae bacterium]
MKKMILVLMAVGLFGAMPVLAAEQYGKKMDTKDDMRQCVLVSETIQEKIKRYEAEVAKGSRKSNPEELKELKRKLDEAKKMLDQMYGP